MSSAYQVGSGFDVHRLGPGRRLILGGVAVPSAKGALGHSDGDCLLHALTDALLGAVAAGDIGDHFPDSDPAWAGAASDRFVAAALRLIVERGWRVLNVDATVFLETPRLAGSERRIAEHVAGLLGVEPGSVSVKAKTGEGLGAVGAGEAVAAAVTILLAATGD